MRLISPTNAFQELANQEPVETGTDAYRLHLRSAQGSRDGRDRRFSNNIREDGCFSSFRFNLVFTKPAKIDK